MICDQCTNSVPDNEDRCPHCGSHAEFPNVVAASLHAEQKALADRYDESIRRAGERQASDVHTRFERAVSNSSAVINTWPDTVVRLAKGDNQVYATFEAVLQAGMRLRDTDPFNDPRHIAEYMLFPGYHARIRFAALSLNDRGAINYGSCTMIMRNELIANRTTVFEENCVLWARQNKINMMDLDDLPPGHRAVWAERGRLAVTKLEPSLHADASNSEFADLLLVSGADSKSDSFVEAHIYGPVTVRAIASVVVYDTRPAQIIILLDAEQRLAEHNVALIMSADV